MERSRRITNISRNPVFSRSSSAKLDTNKSCIYLPRKKRRKLGAMLKLLPVRSTSVISRDPPTTARDPCRLASLDWKGRFHFCCRDYDVYDVWGCCLDSPEWVRQAIELKIDYYYLRHYCKKRRHYWYASLNFYLYGVWGGCVHNIEWERQVIEFG